MRCDICFHESTMYDFVALRNLCEHLYLDALVRRRSGPHDSLSDSEQRDIWSDRRPVLVRS